MGFFSNILDQYCQGGMCAELDESFQVAGAMADQTRIIKKKYLDVDKPDGFLDRIAYKLGYWNEKYDL